MDKFDDNVQTLLLSDIRALKLGTCRDFGCLTFLGADFSWVGKGGKFLLSLSSNLHSD